MLPPFLNSHCCPSSVSSLAIKASMTRRFLSAFRSTAPGQSSPDQHVVLPSRHQPVALRPAFEVLACRVQASFLLVAAPPGSPSRGKFIRKVLGAVLSVYVPLDRYCQLWISLRDDCRLPASFADKIAGILCAAPLPLWSNAHVRFLNLTSARHMFSEHLNPKLFGQGACGSHSSAWTSVHRGTAWIVRIMRASTVLMLRIYPHHPVPRRK